MAHKPTRDVVRIIFDNFWKSLKRAKINKGELKGEDYNGNKYFEIAANPAEGRRKTERWFEPAKKDDFQAELTAEWEAWLRYRRQDPPTREELIQNLQIIEMKKRNAAKLDEKFHGSKEKPQETIGSFPKYDDYEIVPGKNQSNQK